jgi:isopentenyl diphosphate isomerase/L-lactate dehydrogenase-like FMN-dependent dehydrogenase
LSREVEIVLVLTSLGRTSILGYNFSAPIFISPAATPGAVGGYVPKDREMGLIKGSGTGEILYIPALYAEMSIEEIAKAKVQGQVTFQQVRTSQDVCFVLLTSPSNSMPSTIARSTKES